MVNLSDSESDWSKRNLGLQHGAKSIWDRYEIWAGNILARMETSWGRDRRPLLLLNSLSWVGGTAPIVMLWCVCFFHTSGTHTEKPVRGSFGGP